MGMNEREHHIKVLEQFLKETKGKIELYSENKNIDLTKEKEIVETLGYTISSLKTDLKYDLIYEGEEIYTKDEIKAMLIEIQLEIEELCTPPAYQDEDYFLIGTNRCSELIQEKIDKLN